MCTSRSLLPFLLVLSLVWFAGCDSYVTSDNGSPGPSKQSRQPVTTNAMHNGSNKASLNKALSDIRKATAPYNNFKQAVADGYVQFSIHVPNMGIHYLHDSIINSDGTSNLDGNLDPMNPEILLYVNDAPKSPQKRLVAVEYAVPKNSATPRSNAVNLLPGLKKQDWHVHPSSHELPLNNNWTIHGECHYKGGPGVFLAEKPNGDFVFFTPPTGPFGSWNGTVAPSQCPTSLGGKPLPPLLIVHGKWWTLHAWVWYPNPKGVFHPTNPRVGSGS